MIIYERKLSKVVSVQCDRISIDVLSHEFPKINAKCKHCAFELKLFLDDNGSLALLLGFLSRHKITDSHNVLKLLDFALALPTPIQKVIGVIG